MVNEFVASLNFGKSMRWGRRSDSFIRPIRFFSIMMDNEIVEGELFGVKSSNLSYGHRMDSYDKADEMQCYFFHLNTIMFSLLSEKVKIVILNI